MRDAQLFITCASWEPRFLLGLARSLSDLHCRQALVLYSDEYASRTAQARAAAAQTFRDRQIESSELLLYSREPNRTWKESLSAALCTVAEGAQAIVDISTMPRESIWQTFWFLEYRHCIVSYVYNRPAGYGDWLSRDPDSPRLVYKMSGISQIGARTALLILAGYDVDRVQHLVDKYEPAITLLGLQMNSIDPLNAGRMAAQKDAFKGNKSVVPFWLDAYAPDHGRAAILHAIESHAVGHNVLMASMGPKLSAVALYEVHRQHEVFGLVYLPSREFSPDYSHGIGDSIWGELR